MEVPFGQEVEVKIIFTKDGSSCEEKVMANPSFIDGLVAMSVVLFEEDEEPFDLKIDGVTTDVHAYERQSKTFRASSTQPSDLFDPSKQTWAQYLESFEDKQDPRGEEYSICFHGPIRVDIRDFSDRKAFLDGARFLCTLLNQVPADHMRDLHDQEGATYEL